MKELHFLLIELARIDKETNFSYDFDVPAWAVFPEGKEETEEAITLLKKVIEEYYENLEKGKKNENSIV